jgi:hypothetical protein
MGAEDAQEPQEAGPDRFPELEPQALEAEARRLAEEFRRLWSAPGWEDRPWQAFINQAVRNLTKSAWLKLTGKEVRR